MCQAPLDATGRIAEHQNRGKEEHKARENPCHKLISASNIEKIQRNSRNIVLDSPWQFPNDKPTIRSDSSESVAEDSHIRHTRRWREHVCWKL